MYVIVWRFTAADPVTFEEHYGPNGTWAQLFRRSGDYLRTDLLRGSDGLVDVARRVQRLPRGARGGVRTRRCGV